MPGTIAWDPKKTPYPQAKRDDKAGDTFKSKERGEVWVPDPYAWLHRPPSQSEETKAFLEAQAQLTSDYLAQNSDSSKLEAAIKKNWNYPRFSCPARKGDDNYYFNYNSGLQSQSLLYRVPVSLLKPFPESEPDDQPGGSLFFDPNLLSADGTASMSSLAFSDSGRYVAYGISRSGSDWNTVYVRKTENPHPRSADGGGERGSDPGRMGDELRFVKFSGLTWMKDDSGFFYQRFPERKDHVEASHNATGIETDSDVDAMLYFHRIGTSQKEDVLIHKDPTNPTWMWGASVTEDGRFLCLGVRKDTALSNKLWVCDLSKLKTGLAGLGNEGDGVWNKLVDEFGSEYSVITNDGSTLFLLTNKDAPKSKVVAYDFDKPEAGFRDVIPEDNQAILDSVSPVFDKYAAVIYSRDVKDEIYLYELATGRRIKRIGENLIGSVGQLTAKKHHDELFFSLSGFTTPGTVYRYEFKKPEGQELSVFRTTRVEGLSPSDFTEEQVFYPSKDGTQVPMFIVKHKEAGKDAAAVQYGYGGFGISIPPFFSPAIMTFILHYRGVLAVPNIRGGGEYGEEWHLAACFEKKQNCFDDFQAATRYLVDNGYAGEGKVAISGGSNGGLLVAACVNQAPELYGAALADVGVLDMLRFHRFTIGRAWTADYGNPDEPEAFDYLYKYSPLHNIDAQKPYPPLMLLTADHDDRVVPLHSFKHAAALQYIKAGNPNPLLLRVDMKAGHGAGKSTQMKMREAVDKWGFVASSLGLKWHD